MPVASITDPVLVWYRNDLRVNHHQPLAAAMASGRPVSAVYFLCDKQWDDHDVAPLRRWYVLESLRELGGALAKLGVPLTIVDAGDFAAVPTLLKKLIKEQRIAAIYTGREYPLNEVIRDRAVAAMAADCGVPITGYDHSVLVPPRALMTGQGTPYTVFTPYRRSWEKWLASAPPTLSVMPRRIKGASPASFNSELIDRAISCLAVADGLRQRWQPGEAAARKQLAEFAQSALGHYRRDRDFPDLAGTSLLSAALSAGTVSVAECWHLAQPAIQDPQQSDGAACWISELAWRDFYRQIMANYPKLAWGAPFRDDTRMIRWSHDTSLFQAWCEGRTGYPLVDAAQRQLLQTGWMHNRLRMVSAMFLSKHLFIDWRWGERFFMQHLMDGDFAANNGGWQWSSSTGTDAAPYFRVFSPIRQSQRFDPEGHFIRRYVPELAVLEGRAIHEPWKVAAIVPDYPAPIVDHAGVKQRVTEAFRAARP